MLTFEVIFANVQTRITAKMPACCSHVCQTLLVPFNVGINIGINRYGGMSSVIPVVGVNVNVASLGRCKHVLRVHYICSFIIYVPLKKKLA